MLLVNQVLVQKTKRWCTGSTVGTSYARTVLPALGFFERVLGLQVSGLRRDDTTTHLRRLHYHWSTDDRVVRVHWPSRQILRIARRYLLHSLIFPDSLRIRYSNILNANNKFCCLRGNISLRSEYSFLPGLAQAPAGGKGEDKIPHRRQTHFF